MAMACSRLVTLPPFPPFPDRNVPCSMRRMARRTDLLDAFPYRGIGYPPLRDRRTSNCLRPGERPNNTAKQGEGGATSWGGEPRRVLGAALDKAGRLRGKWP